jgi:hypothetical protein
VARTSPGSTSGAGTGSTSGTRTGSTSGTGNGSASAVGATGNTSGTIGNATVLTNADGSKTTTTLNTDGSRSIVTQNLDGSTTTQTIPLRLFNPALINGTEAGVSVEGERLLDERDRALQIDRNSLSFDVPAQQGTALAEVQRSSVSLDRVIKSAEKDRKKIGRNGQLLNTIAPRTNVDRSNEMPDDGPTPALSGLSNSLVRR